MKTKVLLLLLVLSAFTARSQKAYQDYVVNKKGDTIYGTIRQGLATISGAYVLYQKNPDSTRGKVAFFEHPLRNAKSFRFNDRIFLPREESGDLIYDAPKKPDSSVIITKLMKFEHHNKKLPDYIVTMNGDTIFGDIDDPFFSKKSIQTDSKKVRIQKHEVKAYRHNNEIFRLEDKKRVALFEDRKAYLKLLADGKVKLYEFKYTGNAAINLNHDPTFRFIEKDGELHTIQHLLWKKKLSEIFADKPELVKKISNGEYSAENLYLIVKYYNEMPL